jgi:hypothetical protein
MNDQMDSYLSRCLKNWAARSRPPVDGKEKLLRAAVLDKRAAGSEFYSQPGYYPDPRNEYSLVPITQSRMWSFHMAMTFRLAT